MASMFRATALLLALVAWPLQVVCAAEDAAPAGPSEREAQRERIRQQREAIQAQRQQAEAACYQRFAVQDCLNREHNTARDAEAALRKEELRLNEADRRERAAERLRMIEQKKAQAQSAAPGAAPAAVAPGPADGRDQQAQQRALEQRQRQQSHQSEQAARAAGEAERAASAQLRQAEKLKDSQARRERFERQQAEDAALGIKPSAPLPPSPSPVQSPR